MYGIVAGGCYRPLPHAPLITPLHQLPGHDPARPATTNFFNGRFLTATDM